jgi:hypothetical protein
MFVLCPSFAILTISQVNGALVQVGITSGPSVNLVVSQVGSNLDGSSTYAGAFDELSFFYRALLPSEIANSFFLGTQLGL